MLIYKENIRRTVLINPELNQPLNSRNKHYIIMTEIMISYS